jgi:two-component system response regulator MprA
MTSPFVLIVDDDARIRSTLADTFARRGYRVGTAPDGRQALDQVIFRMPDAIVGDAAMALVDGRELVRRLRGRDHQVPVVLTGTRGRVGLPGVQAEPDPRDVGSVVGAVQLGLASRME